MEKSIEQMIVDKGMTAPRVTPQGIEAIIVKREFHRLTDVLTVCVLTLLNGFTVTGESACASPENFDQAIGEAIALKNAKEKVWMLEGYRLKQFLSCNPAPFVYGLPPDVVSAPAPAALDEHRVTVEESGVE